MLKGPLSNEAGTVVGTNVKLTGTLRDNQDIVIYGLVDGEVISEKNVTVAETASVVGPIQAQNVIIGGKVKGAVIAFEKLEILPSGKLHGSLETKELIIRPGATFNGKSVMKNQIEVKEETQKELAGLKIDKREKVVASAKEKFPDYEIEE